MVTARGAISTEQLSVWRLRHEVCVASTRTCKFQAWQVRVCVACMLSDVVVLGVYVHVVDVYDSVVAQT